MQWGEGDRCNGCGEMGGEAGSSPPGVQLAGALSPAVHHRSCNAQRAELRAELNWLW